jgi:hypothetical protein
MVGPTRYGTKEKLVPTLKSFIPDWRANAAPAYKPSTLATTESSIRAWLLPAPIKETRVLF